MEEDGDAVVLEVSEAPRVGLDGLYLAVEPFRHRVGDVTVVVRQEVPEAPGEGLGGLDDRREFRREHLAVPEVEEGLGVFLPPPRPEAPEELLDAPCRRGPEGLPQESAQLGGCLRAEMSQALEPEVARVREPPVVLLPEPGALGPPDAVDGVRA